MRNGWVFVLLLSAANAFVPTGVMAHISADAQTEATCPVPNVSAKVMVAAAPETPPLARSQHIIGAVQVLVTLDEQSHITNAQIRSSPSTVLNASAIAAARGSVFQTEIRNCIAVPQDYIFVVEFTRDGPSSSAAPFNVRPAITDFFQGIWSCTAPYSSQIVKSYGLLDDLVTLYLDNSYIMPDGRHFSGTERYTQTGNTLTAIIRNGTFASTTNSRGFDGDSLTFIGAQQTTELVRQRETIVRNGHDAFHRTFETAVMNDSPAIWHQTGTEDCRRIVN